MPSVTIDTNVDIIASRNDVWDVLTDFSSYNKWCPTMRIEGALRSAAGSPCICQAMAAMA